jgi:hypothetical protein
MIEFLVIFALTAVGSLVRLSSIVTLKLFSPETQGETMAAGPGRSWSTAAAPPADPILRFGLILACDGALVLVLVSAFPGALAFERAGLAFALLCAGGLIGEIAGAGGGPRPAAADGDAEQSVPDAALSRRLSLSLTVMLNLSLAVLISGRGLVEIVPPTPAASNHPQELESVIVIAERPYDPLDERNAPF